MRYEAADTRDDVLTGEEQIVRSEGKASELGRTSYFNTSKVGRTGPTSRKRFMQRPETKGTYAAASQGNETKGNEGGRVLFSRPGGSRSLKKGTDLANGWGREERLKEGKDQTLNWSGNPH